MGSSPPFYVNSEKIIIPPLKSIGYLLSTESITVSLQLNYTTTGGSFTVTLLKDALSPLPVEDAIISLPFGRVGVVKNVSSGWSSSGMVDTISGVIQPLQASQIFFYGIEPNAAQFLAQLASTIMNGASVLWQTTSVPIKNFSFRGPSMSGLQQLASYVLGDIIVRKDGIYVVDPGAAPFGSQIFTVPKSDIVSATQAIDYTLDVASQLNPALFAGQLNNEGDFVYDSDHAQKQPNTQISAGTANNGFTPIPDGWLIDGTFEEWTPVPGSGTNDNPSPTVGRYWKQFPSPTNPGSMRGITDFKRIIKDFSSQPGNISTFIGSPVTAQSQGSTGPPNSFQFLGGDTNNGIYGFNLSDTVVSDAVSGQYLELTKALTLFPIGGDAGDASLNFYSLQVGFWMFPRVNPTTFPVGDPVNPFGIPRNVVTVNPSANVANLGGGIVNYYQKYLSNFQLINSPRLKTNVSVVYRNNSPQVGDSLSVVSGLRFQDCGRIQSVGLNFGRNGMVLNITAEKYQFSPGLWSFGAGNEIVL